MSGQKILITEDEKITALDIKLSLEHLGYEVAGSVDTGETAIKLAGELQPDLVLMDIHLKSEMLGTEAAEEIYRRYDVPVIFLSAYSDRSIIEKAGRSAPYGYLIKPYDARELDAAIQVALTKHKSDAQVRKSDTRLRMALDAADMTAWEWAPQELVVSDNQHEDRGAILSEDMDDLISLIHPSDREQIIRALASDGRISCQVRMITKESNHYRHVELFAAAFKGDNVKNKVIGVARDVEDDYQRQERLRQAQVVFDSISEAILITDSARRVISVNPAFETITGYSSLEVIGQDPDEFLHARRNSDHFSPRLAEQGNHFWSGEVACHTKEGQRFPAWEHVAGVFDESGNIQNYVFTVSDIGDLRRAEKSLARMAFLDSLTGVGNRVHLERTLSEALKDSVRIKKPVAVLYIDLDGFKSINDTLGHAEGDRLLQIVAERFVSSVRDADIVTRVGGDEFVIVVPGVDRDEGLAVMSRKLLLSVCAPITLSREVVEVSASIGIAISSNELNSHESLITAADTALFHAKHKGKNCFQFYDFELAMVSGEKVRIERNMKGALNSHEICVEFQPLIDVKNNRVYGAEALCRWYSHDMGGIPPDRFSPIAEQSNVILELGAQVLDESCKEVKRWHQAGMTDYVVSVNVSARQLNDKRFPEIVREAIKRNGVRPDCVELEITETAIQNNKHAKIQLDLLRDLGVRFAIDDFGTGYSSLSRLKSLPFDRVKIDRSFVMDLPDSESDIEICRAILALCSVLGMNVTAEGIENVQQLNLLKEMGCGCAQGFYFSRSMPGDRFMEWAMQYEEKAKAS
ncbi:MAG: EAL domain-containing protein [Thalassolituus sp.]